jgi:hypothetical protein
MLQLGLPQKMHGESLAMDKKSLGSEELALLPWRLLE